MLISLLTQKEKLHSVDPDQCKRITAQKILQSDWFTLALYILFAIAVLTLFFVKNLDGAASFLQKYDNITHLGTIRNFIDTGVFSPFASNLHLLTSSNQNYGPMVDADASFYPTAWHCIAALTAGALDIPIPLAINAVNFTFTAIVFPSGMFLLMQRFFGCKPAIVQLGAIATMAFVGFPLNLLSYGPLYPNLASFCIMPLVIFFFISIFSKNISLFSRALMALLFALALITSALTQPNTVFSIAVFLIPYCAYLIVFTVKRSHRFSKKHTASMILVGTFLCLTIAIWTFLFYAPFMQGVVTFHWNSFASKSQAIINLLTLSFTTRNAAQIILGIAVLAGIAYSIYKPQYLWLSCAFALAGIMYIVNASSDGFLKQYLTGFWYTDTFRIGAMTAIFGMPIASMGLFAIGKIVLLFVKTSIPSILTNKKGVTITTGVLIIAFIGVNFYPNYTLPGNAEATKTGFGAVSSLLASLNNTTGSQVLDDEEIVFIREAENIVPKDALVINSPNDGSAFAYGGMQTELNIYYLYLNQYRGSNEVIESPIIRLHLNEIASNEDVKKAVHTVGAQYVLLLDQGEDVNGKRLFLSFYHKNEWVGIDSITDSTPGFEVVLSRDDMRLYKITA